MRTLVALIAVAVLLVLSSAALPQQNPNCREFGFQITTSCCCTNDCCREAEAGEFVHIDGDRYRSTVTGQMVFRTGWSPDGRTIKCACDQINGVWTKHPRANVRCLFMPMPSS
jgi:hypothetical protein